VKWRFFFLVVLASFIDGYSLYADGLVAIVIPQIFDLGIIMYGFSRIRYTSRLRALPLLLISATILFGFRDVSFAEAINIKAFIRYVPLIIVKQPIFQKEERADFMRAIVYLAAIHLLFSVSLDIFNVVSPFLEKNYLEFAGYNRQFRTEDIRAVNAYVGFMGHPPTFAFLLVIAIICNQRADFFGMLLNLFFLYGLIKTNSVALILFGTLFSVRSLRSAYKLMIPLAIVPVLMSASAVLLNRLNISYVLYEASQNRLWLILDVLPTIISISILGFGADLGNVISAVYGELASRKVLVYSAWEDVYYLTIFYYYGIVTLFVYVLTLNKSRRTSWLAKKRVMNVFILMNFLIVVPEIRFISLIYWVLYASE